MGDEDTRKAAGYSLVEETAGPDPSGHAAVAGLGETAIHGVFSTQTVASVGTGTTKRKTIQKTYWFAEEIEGGIIQVQPLNTNYVPSGNRIDIPRDDFLLKYNTEPEFYIQTVLPRMQELDSTIKRGEDHREAGRAYSAEFEFGQAVAVDEENVRANFGLGLTYLDRGDSIRANDIFERIVHLEAAFELEHKHLFNDFGINMRKNRMLEQALEYYNRAATMEQNDENLFHNIARVYFEMGKLEECVEYLDKALEVHPDMEEAKRFKGYLERHGCLKDGKVVDSPPPLPTSKKSKADQGTGSSFNVDGNVEF